MISMKDNMVLYVSRKMEEGVSTSLEFALMNHYEKSKTTLKSEKQDFVHRT